MSPVCAPAEAGSVAAIRPTTAADHHPLGILPSLMSLRKPHFDPTAPRPPPGQAAPDPREGRALRARPPRHRPRARALPDQFLSRLLALHPLRRGCGFPLPLAPHLPAARPLRTRGDAHSDEHTSDLQSLT